MDLTAGKRKHLPDSAFVGPDRSFPVTDLEHARLAISGAARALNAGNISQDEHDKIVKRAHGYLRLHEAMGMRR